MANKEQSKKTNQLVNNLLTIGIDIEVETLMQTLKSNKHYFIKRLLKHQETLRAVACGYACLKVGERLLNGYELPETDLQVKLEGLGKTRQEIINMDLRKNIMMSDILTIREYADRANDLRVYIKENVEDLGEEIYNAFGLD